MLVSSNQQLGWAEADGFVTARWPSASECERRAIFASAHEIVLTPTWTFDRALEVAHTHRAHAPLAAVRSPASRASASRGRRCVESAGAPSILVGGRPPGAGDPVVHAAVDRP